MRKFAGSVALSLILALGLGLAGQRYVSGQPLGFPWTQNADSSITWIVPQNNPLGLQRNEPIRPGGRLTLTAGTPVQNAAVVNGTQIFYVGYSGNSVPVFNPPISVTQPPVPPST